MLEILLITLRDVLLQVWSYHLDTLELDLDKAILEELQAGPQSCLSYLRGVVTDLWELLDRSWKITLNHTQRSVNLVASVLAFLYKDQRDVLVIHAEPPRSLQATLDLDIQTFQLAQKLQAEVNYFDEASV